MLLSISYVSGVFDQDQFLDLSWYVYVLSAHRFTNKVTFNHKAAEVL